jgi:hypothetical protein
VWSSRDTPRPDVRAGGPALEQEAILGALGRLADWTGPRTARTYRVATSSGCCLRRCHGSLPARDADGRRECRGRVRAAVVRLLGRLDRPGSRMSRSSIPRATPRRGACRPLRAGPPPRRSRRTTMARAARAATVPLRGRAAPSHVLAGMDAAARLGRAGTAGAAGRRGRRAAGSRRAGDAALPSSTSTSTVR